MTSQKDQIQSLIADIEAVLGAEKPRKPWIRVSETEPQRQALTRVQNYLRSLQQAFDAPGGWGPVDPSTGQVTGSTTDSATGQAATGDSKIKPVAGSSSNVPISPGIQGIFSGGAASQPSAVGQPTNASDGSAEDVLQALLTEMTFLRSSALEPLRREMDTLRAQRDRLQQEVSNLAEERSALTVSESSLASSQPTAVSEDQLNQFLAALMDRLQERLSVQVTQTLNQLESDHAEAVSRLSSGDPEVLQLRPREPLQEIQLEEIRELQLRSDQLIVNIESTLQGMFETLQRNIDSYQFSLNEGIENMHSLGRQGEVIVRSLVDHLTQQLGQTATPEPAFFPTRSTEPALALSNSEALEDSDTFGNTTSDAPDTVASLDDILPEIADEASVETSVETVDSEGFEADLANAVEAVDSEGFEAELTHAVEAATGESFEADLTHASETDDREVRPEDCIREDGTIDLDLLKLDIDRDDQDANLTSEDVMVDAAIADAQIAATEVEDPEIEAKVLPTADAAFLADLTLDDLTGDKSDESEIDNLRSDQPSDAPSEQLDPNFQPTDDEADLATILPNLGQPVDEPVNEPVNEPVDEPIDESDESQSILDEANDESVHVIEALSSEESDDAAAVDAEMTVSEGTESEEVTVSEEIDEATDASESDSASMAAVLAAAALGAAVAGRTSTPEAAATPGAISDAVLPEVVSPATADSPTSDTVSQNLAAELDAANQEAIRVSRESIASGLNVLESESQPSSTVESPVSASPIVDTPVVDSPVVDSPIFYGEVPQPAILDESAQPLESALIPDVPEAYDETDEPEELTSEDVTAEAIYIREDAFDSLATDPLEASLMELEADREASSVDAEEENGSEIEGLATDLDEMTEPRTPITDESLDEDLWADSIDLPSASLGESAQEDLLVEALIEAEIPSESRPEIMAEPSSTIEQEESLVDFDDDLDFYSAETVIEDSADEPADEPADNLTELPSTADSENIANDATAYTQPAYAQPDLAAEDSAITDAVRLPDPPVMPPLFNSESRTNTTGSVVAAAPVPVSSEAPELISKLSSGDDDSGDRDDHDPTQDQPTAWFLGIDVGTSGLSAVLINQLGNQVYPLCWNIPGDDEANRFRLPAVLQMDGQPGVEIGAASTIGPAALQQSTHLLRNIKPLLKVGIPHSTGEPWIQWSDRQILPLLALQIALTSLLRTLSVNGNANRNSDPMSCQAVGLKTGALRRALANLKGVIVGYPYNWPDTYSFNVREAVLTAGIVSRPEQVFFIEEAIAALLSALPDPKMATADLDSQQPGLYNCNWTGGTVVISAGATLTEAAIADLPAELDQLIYRDFALRSFTYGGDSLDQDIICQLLHPPAQAQIAANVTAPDANAESNVDNNAENNWQSLGLDQLHLPQAGEADRAKRHRLRQRLNGLPLGRAAIDAAREIKRTLQEETQVELTVGDQTWVIKRNDLETKVFLPYIQRVNRQVNGLLSQKGLTAQAVRQVVCTGGSASLGAIARWLRQKFPNATIIQDTYSGEYSNSCSRVAYGLANLCHYPYVLDTNRHQYSDYFLLLELLRVLPDQPLPAGGILHLLEQRGINTQACQAHILALIEGHLPPGLVPTEGDRPLISAQSPDIGIYQQLAELPLFRKQGGQIYIADPQQGERLRNHLETLLATKSQVLIEPLTVELAAEIPSS